ncbi:DUF4221 family protein [Algoriphagus machipongonensis]|uniref:Lipoprotein n=1 Tax=Algoriphagus machipongonensis TaxID=388413 RepID=A3HUB2_9BACT|nr:DUF4221 family protein [Algoriphagus machipongonensis]EAZ81734.2 hypothetical protein ALPR1_00795 [Algoriphagus machipongonensis]
MRIAYLLIFICVIFSCQKKDESKVELNEPTIVRNPIDSLKKDPEKEDSIISIEEEEAQEEIQKAEDLTPTNFLENLSFKIDTVLTDSKGTLIYLPQGLNNSDVSPNKKFLYALNKKSNNLYQFDLERLELVESYQFEKEGPNSVQPRIWYFQLLDNNQIGFTDYHSFGIYNFQTQKLSSYQFSEKDFSDLIDTPTEAKYESLQFSADGKEIYFLHQNIEREKVYLGIFDPKINKEKLVDLVEFKFLTRLRFTHSEGIAHHIADFANLGVKVEKNRVLIYSKGTSKVYIYDLTSGTLTFKSPQHEIVPNDQIPPFSNKVSSSEEVREASNSLVFQISYRDFLYDDQREMYFRFASILEDTDDLNAKSEKEVYLFAYDKKLNLIGETKIDELVKVPNYPFFKDGKLWSYVNIEDELGFAIFTFNF